MTYALMLAFFRNDMGFGGNNGLTDFKDILGFNVQAHATRAALFARRALALGARLPASAARSSRSKLGKVLIAVRDAESRTRFLGYRVENYKLVRLHASRPCMAGVAGALYVPQVGIINPERVRARQLDRGGDLGRGRRARHAGRRGRSARSLVNSGKTWFTGALPELWLFALGGLFVARHAVPAQGHRRHCVRAGLRGGAQAAGGRAEAGDGRPRCRDDAGGVSAMPSRRSTRARPQRCSISTASASPSTASRRSTSSRWSLEPRRDARHHRPERRRQDDDDGRHHRQDPARRRRRSLFDGDVDLTRLDEADIADLGIGRKFQKPTVFESHTVEDNIAAGAEGRPRPRSPSLFGWRNRVAARSASTRSSTTIRLARPPRARRRPISRTARSNGWRSACCWRRTRSCSCRRAGRRHDRRRDRGRPRAPDATSPATIRSSWSSTTCTSCARSTCKVTCCTRARCWPKARIDAVSADRARRRSLSGALTHAERRGHRSPLRRRPGAARRLARRPRPGKVTCVLGRNGVGKTSLLRAIVGQQPIATGAISSRARTSRRLAPLRPGARAASPSCRRAARSSRC